MPLFAFMSVASNGSETYQEHTFALRSHAIAAASLLREATQVSVGMWVQMPNGSGVGAMRPRRFLGRGRLRPRTYI